jgi:hypothetical protein
MNDVGTGHLWVSGPDATAPRGFGAIGQIVGEGLAGGGGPDAGTVLDEDAMDAPRDRVMAENQAGRAVGVGWCVIPDPVVVRSVFAIPAPTLIAPSEPS